MREVLEAQRKERAERRVQMFVAEFEPSYKALAYHAALPLVLTPELVNYLRNEFLRSEGVPWVAEADLLLSELCSSVGYELYAMDADVRAYLLEQMATDQAFGPERMQRVAKLLVSYVRYLSDQGAQMSDGELEAQQWAAMLYLGPGQKQQVAEEIATKFQLNAVEQVGGELLSQAELGRLADLTKTFAPQLYEYAELVEYAALVSDVLVGREDISTARVTRSYEVMPGVRVKIPPTIVDSGRSTPGDNISAVSPGVDPQFPPLEEFEFIDVQLIDEPVEDPVGESVDFPPPLQTEAFTVLTFEPEVESGLKPETEPETDSSAEQFNFTVAILIKEEDQWQLQRQQGRNSRFLEILTGELFQETKEVVLEMVAIPGGSFTMGSPKEEEGHYGDEGPQHEVTLEPFFLGRYPVTQAQWQVVAGLPQVQRELDPDPSEFKGDLRPVEQVSWYDAEEFCARLSAHTGRSYRLPSEAEWEYACRAGTTTAFSFGEMITTEVANYNGNAYADGPAGESRGETTPVNQFELANPWGLSDMHGNVHEWCLDHWHESYEDAPTDGDAWLTEDEEASRVFRGGSWASDPRNCRSAYRINYRPDNRDSDIGFRVCCAAPRAVE